MDLGDAGLHSRCGINFSDFFHNQGKPHSAEMRRDPVSSRGATRYGLILNSGVTKYAVWSF